MRYERKALDCRVLVTSLSLTPDTTICCRRVLPDACTRVGNAAGPEREVDHVPATTPGRSRSWRPRIHEWSGSWHRDVATCTDGRACLPGFDRNPQLTRILARVPWTLIICAGYEVERLLDRGRQEGLAPCG
jgi:hypothetical protein